MNIALWIGQVLLALMFITLGRAHAFSQSQMKTRPGLGWVANVPKPLMTFIGISEIAGGLGVVLPMLSGILPWLTPLAAALLALVMVLAFIFHVARKEYRNLGINAFLFFLGVFVAYGRWKLLTI